MGRRLGPEVGVGGGVELLQCTESVIQTLRAILSMYSGACTESVTVTLSMHRVPDCLYQQAMESRA